VQSIPADRSAENSARTRHPNGALAIGAWRSRHPLRQSAVLRSDCHWISAHSKRDETRVKLAKMPGRLTRKWRNGIGPRKCAASPARTTQAVQRMASKGMTWRVQRPRWMTASTIRSC